MGYINEKLCILSNVYVKPKYASCAEVYLLGFSSFHFIIIILVVFQFDIKARFIKSIL